VTRFEAPALLTTDVGQAQNLTGEWGTPVQGDCGRLESMGYFRRNHGAY